MILYRDELKLIIRAVAEVGEPSIQIPKFTVDTAEDLDNDVLSKRLQWLEVSAACDKREITVSLGRERAEVKLVEPDTLWFSSEDFVRRRRIQSGVGRSRVAAARASYADSVA